MQRLATILATCSATALALWPLESHSPRYIWNASESVPIGLYRLQEVGRLGITQLVAVRPPEPLAAFLNLRGYFPSGLPMLKRVLALPGQTVCRTGPTILVDSVEMGHARQRDSRGRLLPIWRGCRVIVDGEIFLMNRQSAQSFDGRYFGPIPASAVIGQAFPVWTKEE
jgi:conjugative transfer signal peptidase TraF